MARICTEHLPQLSLHETRDVGELILLINKMETVMHTKTRHDGVTSKEP